MDRYVHDKYVIIGLTVSEAAVKVKPFGKTIRVMQKDGVGITGSYNFDPNRINVATDGEIITNILRTG